MPVSTGETVAIDLLLEVGGIEASVVVTGRAEDRPRESAGLGQVVSAEQVQRLPLNGRSFISLAALSPGVALPPGSSLPRINGGRPRTNEYIFDGISVLQPEPGQVPFFPNIDAIQDFRIETNSPPAEFGRFNGGVVNLTTRAGGATVSGSAFEFLRHEALNARNPFAPADSSPRFRRNQFGGVMGGPIAKNRTFFFADYQGQRQEIARTVISTVPTALQRQGIFTEPVAGRVPVIYDPATTTTSAAGAATRTPFAGNVIPQERMDPVALDLLGRYPLPTSPGTANNYTRVANETVDNDLFGLRLDHRLADRGDRVFARVTRFAETFLPVDAAARRQRRHHRHAGAAGDRRLGAGVGLPAGALPDAAERGAGRGHPPLRATARRDAAHEPRRGPGPARHPLDRELPVHTAHVPDGRLPACWGRHSTPPATSARTSPRWPTR